MFSTAYVYNAKITPNDHLGTINSDSENIIGEHYITVAQLALTRGNRDP
jgi:hypothetical protein